MNVRLPFRDSEIELALPDTWRVIAEGRPKSVAPCASVEQEFARAMAEPIGSSPLATRNLRGKKIVLVVDDLTRPTPAQLFFPLLLHELERAGAERQNLLLIPALGVHRPMTAAEMEIKVGREALAQVRWENHDARDVEGVVCVGATKAKTEVYINRHLVEADLIVSVSSVEPHVLAGFGGGLKNIVPGCAGVETIAHNHWWGTTTKEPAQIGAEPDANPLRRDLEEAAGLLHAEVFIVNPVLAPPADSKHDAGIVKIFAGHAKLAHREGLKLAREIYGVPVPEPADVLITDSAPMTANFRQGVKCIGNALAAVKERGTILALLDCREGLGDFNLSGRSLPGPIMKALVRRMKREKLPAFIERFRRDLPVEEKFLAVYGLEILRRNDVLAYAPAISQRDANRLGFLRIVAEPQELIRHAAARAPRNATVAIFPQGGVTYPILARSS
ncbi:MAG TPA: nickel-dependent lactate racemase [Terriglobia bacterium]|nr:nickel-dependent lactate racemase [Terriglobia bacterium]